MLVIIVYRFLSGLIATLLVFLSVVPAGGHTIEDLEKLLSKQEFYVEITNRAAI